MGYAETLNKLSRRNVLKFGLSSIGTTVLAAIGIYFQEQDPYYQTKNCLQTQFSKAGLAIAEKARTNDFNPVVIDKTKFYINELKGDPADDKNTARMRENFAVKGVILSQEGKESPKVQVLINYASHIFKETGFTRKELRNFSDQQVAYVLLETAKRAEDIYLRCATS